MGGFVIALTISIQASFSNIEVNTAAHDLGIGLLLAWLPVLALSTITDRNPIATDKIGRELDRLVESVRVALLDHECRRIYAARIDKTVQDFDWVELLRYEEFIYHRFFAGFAGQGRIRWHVRVIRA